MHLALLGETAASLAAIRQIVEARGKVNVDEHLEAVLRAVAEALDDHRHAPRCPANHYHGQQTPLPRCTCGAWKNGHRMTNHPCLGAECL